MEGKNGERFVTYKGLVITIIAIVGTTLTFSGIIIAYLSEQFNRKVDKELFSLQTSIICTDLASLRASNDKQVQKLHDIELLIRKSNNK